MLLSHCPYGGKKAGFILKIREDGFNGIAGTFPAEDVRMMNARLKDGGR